MVISFSSSKSLESPPALKKEIDSSPFSAFSTNLFRKAEPCINRENIPSKLIAAENYIEAFFVKIKLWKKNWRLCSSSKSSFH